MKLEGKPKVFEDEDKFSFGDLFELCTGEFPFASVI